jgi:hypothetical protein
MLPRQFLQVLGISLLSACAGSSTVPRSYSVPADAQNPIVIRYEGATPDEMTEIVAQMCADVPIAKSQVVPERGYVETRWADIGEFSLGLQADVYPLPERQVVYVFQAQETGEYSGVLQIGGWYQPTRPPGQSPKRDSRYDRFIPTDHPGYQLMLQFEFRLNELFAQRGVQVVESNTAGG